MAKERRTIRYDNDVWELLETHAKETGRPIAAIVNEAVRHYLIQSQPPLEARVATLEARLAALEEKL
jgi:predicted transcriptional regulator